MVSNKRQCNDESDGIKQEHNGDEGIINGDHSSDFEPIALGHIPHLNYHNQSSSDVDHYHDTRSSPPPPSGSSVDSVGSGSRYSGGSGQERATASKKIKVDPSHGSSSSTGGSKRSINGKATSSHPTSKSKVKSSPPSNSQVKSSLTSTSRKTLKPPVINKGLRHFSMKVCEKVEAAGTTSYNEVAEELVRELKAADEAVAAANGDKKQKKSYDEKNIRRRVYDALNVLMAMDIITKDKKQITWRGLPGRRREDCSNPEDHQYGYDSSNCYGDENDYPTPEEMKIRQENMEKLFEEKNKREKAIKRKRECLQELIVQNVCFRNLIGRNHARETDEYYSNLASDKFYGSRQRDHHTRALPEQDNDGSVKAMKDEKIPLPFIVVNTHSKAVIQCDMCPKRINVNFDFTLPFEINDDNEILKRLGMNHTSRATLQRTLPPNIFSYCNSQGLFQDVIR